MYPRQHILYGFILSALLYFLLHIPLYGAIALFLASFLIDFDHYITACYAKGRLVGYHEAFVFHDENGKKFEKLAKKGIHKKELLNVFHTVEVQLLTLLLGIYVHPVFYYILLGMLFHIALDIVQLSRMGILHIREFSIIHYLININSDKQ